MELENIVSEVTQSQKNTNGMHSLISEYYQWIAEKLQITKVQLTAHMKLKEKEN